MLRAKVDALAAPEDGIFGPLAATEPGEERKPELDAAATGAQAYTAVTRGLGKEDVGSGHGLSAEIQTGTSRRSDRARVFVPSALSEWRRGYKR